MRKLEFSVTERELDTIVPALLMWQFELAHTQRNHKSLYEKASNHGKPLSDNEIRLLVERINCGGIDVEVRPQPEKFVIRLTQEEIETGIAALRTLENETCDDRSAEIDDLCQKLNCAEPAGVELFEQSRLDQTEQLPSIEELVKDPSTPYWALNVIHEAAKKDPVDAATTLEVIAKAFDYRARLLFAGGNKAVENLYDER